MKSIIKCGLLLLGLGTATVSCEDMFTADNTLVTTELAPQDTLYQMMGIIKRMQKLADRTVLLGEVRADLVDVDPLHASADIQELAANNVSATNVYNQPSDYYAVINSCNIYLAYVDSMRNSQGTRKYFEKEILAAKCYRAWCYLELLKIYGDVPYIRTPVLNSDDAEGIVASGKKEGMVTIVTDMINDLVNFRAAENDELRQSYGNRTFNGIRYSEMVIPVRAMLAELYLWRASYTGNESDYINAIRMYHDYFTFPSEEINTGSANANWPSRDSERPNTSDYNSNFLDASQCAGVLPMETSQYYGTVSKLRGVFCSLDSNNYYPAVVASQRAKDISKAQDYCQFLVEGGGMPEIYFREHDPNLYSDYKTMEGDLRLYAVSDGPDNVKDNSSNSHENSSYNNMYYLNRKYGTTTNGNSYLPFVPYFRNNILYLHFAEALNRAGFPETAFAILKYGLSYYTLTNRSIVSKDEFDRLCLITSIGFTVQEPKFTDDDLKKQTTGTAAVWSSDVFATYFIVPLDQMNPQRIVEGGNYIQVGIHSFGSGDSEYNDRYFLDDEETKSGLKAYKEDLELEEVPRLSRNSTHEDSVEYDRVVAYNAYADSVNIAQKDSVDSYNAEYLASPDIRTKRQAHVSKLILEEEALEGVFEGQRFYDIMRYQMQEMGGSAIGTTIAMPAYIEEKYGTTTKMAGKPWFLKLPTR
ncbi:MAG: RagB/SusD family nutrient uptake outer membrane protein [Bacteroidaceae bacterium]|nr:RagB/SusD family nutrient uptake outer membrane protein [Bacteroidaceae bacterium]